MWLINDIVQLHCETPVNTRGHGMLTFEVTPREDKNGEKPDFSMCILANSAHHYVQYSERYKMNFKKDEHEIYHFTSQSGLSPEDVAEIKQKPCPFQAGTMEQWM
eukprot:Phypoly_transcript_24481.p1 GENE.Phypoly_transcript_24481~~Phypoly_transcript_24481.p1  ORF type:complete len:105 (+),score=9.08 Phypoly_transcript_24481:194-508(+)